MFILHKFWKKTSFQIFYVGYPLKIKLPKKALRKNILNKFTKNKILSLSKTFRLKKNLIKKDNYKSKKLKIGLKIKNRHRIGHKRRDVLCYKALFLVILSKCNFNTTVNKTLFLSKTLNLSYKKKRKFNKKKYIKEKIKPFKQRFKNKKLFIKMVKTKNYKKIRSNKKYLKKIKPIRMVTALIGRCSNKKFKNKTRRVTAKCKQ